MGVTADDEELSDAGLLLRWKDGDRGAGEALLRQYQPRLVRFFQNKTSRGADDLVQQTMMAAMDGRDRFEGRASFRAYLFSIARYTLYEHYRSNRRSDEVLEFNTVTLFDISPSPSVHAAARSEQRILLEALRRLPVNLQIALELHYWEDLSGPELAEILEIPVDTVYSRLRKAKELLKKKIKVMESSPDLLHETVTNLNSWARSIRDRASDSETDELDELDDAETER
jgi:RNA polymerase sigma factor (sigma-70 family)